MATEYRRPVVTRVNVQHLLDLAQSAVDRADDAAAVLYLADAYEALKRLTGRR